MQVTILGERRSSLPANWVKETLVAILGDARVDATRTGPDASLTVIGLFADATIRVPRGSRISDGGFSLLGDRKITVSPGEGPEIRVNSYGLLSDVQVTE